MGKDTKNTEPQITLFQNVNNNKIIPSYLDLGINNKVTGLFYNNVIYSLFSFLSSLPQRKGKKRGKSERTIQNTTLCNLSIFGAILVLKYYIKNQEVCQIIVNKYNISIIVECWGAGNGSFVQIS